MSTNSEPAPEVRLSPFGLRVGATLLDGIFMAFLAFLVAMGLGFLGIFVGMFRPEEELPLNTLIVVSAILVSFAYYVGTWGGKSGQTLGHFMIGGRVVAKDGGRLGYGRATVRYIGFIISGLLLSLGFLWAQFDKKRQGLHDKLAGSYVVNIDDEFENENVTLVASDAGKGIGWLVLWVVLAVAAPAALFGSLLVLGPAVARMIKALLAG